MALSIDLPATLTVSIEETDPEDWDPFRYADPPCFIVLSFGAFKVRRWEWMGDTELESRWKPSIEEAEEFVSQKLARLLEGVV